MKKTLLSLLLISWAALGYSLNETPDTSEESDLNSIMSPTDQKKTGVHKLDKDERQELENWLKNYNATKNPAQAQAIENFEPFIAKLTINARGGEFLILDNDSVWAIDPDDTVVSSGWLSPVPISVTLVEQTEYPFRLTNQLSGQDVGAKKASWDDIPESDGFPPLEEESQNPQTPQQPIPTDNTPPPVQTPLQHRQSLQSRQQQPIPNQNNPVPNPPNTGIDQAE